MPTVDNRIQFTAKDKGVVSTMKAIGKESLKTEKSIKRTSKAIKGYGSMLRKHKYASDLARKGMKDWRLEMVDFNRSLYTAAALVGWFVTFVRTSWRAAMESASMISIEEAFFGAFADRNKAQKFLKVLQEATKYTISSFEAMRAANLAMKLGIKKDNIPKLLGLARKAALALGVSTGQMAEDVMRALGRQSTKVLDNLGVVLKQREAYEAYAKTLGKSYKSLTDNEKRLAFQTVALQKLTDAYKNLNGEQLRTVDKLRIIDASVKQMNTRWGQFIAEAIAPLHERFKKLAVQTNVFFSRFKENKGFQAFVNAVFYGLGGISALGTGMSLVALAMARLGIGLRGLSLGLSGMVIIWMMVHKKGESIAKTFERIGYVVGGVYQLVRSYNGEIARMDLETFEALGGISGEAFKNAWKLFKVLIYIKNFAEGAFEGLNLFFRGISNTIKWILTALSSILKFSNKLTGGLLGSLPGIGTAFQDQPTKMWKGYESLAKNIGKVVGVYVGLKMILGKLVPGISKIPLIGKFFQRRPKGSFSDPIWVQDRMMGIGGKGGKGVGGRALGGLFTKGAWRNTLLAAKYGHAGRSVQMGGIGGFAGGAKALGGASVGTLASSGIAGIATIVAAVLVAGAVGAGIGYLIQKYMWKKHMDWETGTEEGKKWVKEQTMKTVKQGSIKDLEIYKERYGLDRGKFGDIEKRIQAEDWSDPDVVSGHESNVRNIMFRLQNLTKSPEEENDLKEELINIFKEDGLRKNELIRVLKKLDDRLEEAKTDKFLEVASDSPLI